MLNTQRRMMGLTKNLWPVGLISMDAYPGLCPADVEDQIFQESSQ
jgi:hypothetical protein